MAVTISIVALFGIALFFMLRSGTLTWGGAFIAIMFGFYLAATGAADPVNHLTNAVVHALQDL